MDFLKSTTKALWKNAKQNADGTYDLNLKDGTYISAKGKNVMVIGGGDTGNDCVGTSMRHGAKSVLQLEMMPKAPDERTEMNPWPEWPRVCKTDYGQQEAAAVFGHDPRVYQTTVKEFKKDKNGKVCKAVLVKLESKKNEKTGRMMMTEADIAAEGGSILFVGTKKQAQDAIKVEAERCGMYYVNERWLGGMLTNFKTIKSRIARLKNIERMSEDGTFDVLPKKEVIQLKKEWDKLEKNLGGIKDMKTLPDAIFVVDPKKERICVQEAHTLGIPLIGIADTNCDPEELDYVIPGNDDAIRAVKLIVSKMADAVVEANQGVAGEEEYVEEAEEAAVEE